MDRGLGSPATPTLACCPPAGCNLTQASAALHAEVSVKVSAPNEHKHMRHAQSQKRLARRGQEEGCVLEDNLKGTWIACTL